MKREQEIIIHICPKCKEPLSKETDAELSKEYDYVCHNCEENFYFYEAITIRY